MAPDRPGTRVFPPALPAAALVLAIALQWLLPLDLLPRPPSTALRLIGLLLIAAAFALMVWAVRTFRRAGTSPNPHGTASALVEAGPFRFSRNPMYLGLQVVLGGIGLAVPLEWAIILLPFLWAALHFWVVLPEEAYLGRRFGPAYEGYLARTRRWI